MNSEQRGTDVRDRPDRGWISRYATYFVFVVSTVILLSLATGDPTVGQTQDIEIVAEFPTLL